MDEYKELFYSRINHKLGNYGDVSARIELRRGLECRFVCLTHLEQTETYIGNLFLYRCGSHRIIYLCARMGYSWFPYGRKSADRTKPHFDVIFFCFFLAHFLAT